MPVIILDMSRHFDYKAMFDSQAEPFGKPAPTGLSVTAFGAEGYKTLRRAKFRELIHGTI